MPRIKADDSRVQEMYRELARQVPDIIKVNESSILDSVNSSSINQAVLIVKMTVDLGHKTFAAKLSLESSPVITKHRDRREIKAEDPDQGQLLPPEVGRRTAPAPEEAPASESAPVMPDPPADEDNKPPPAPTQAAPAKRGRKPGSKNKPKGSTVAKDPDEGEE